MIVGFPFGGKTTAYCMLADALAKLEEKVLRIVDGFIHSGLSTVVYTVHQSVDFNLPHNHFQFLECCECYVNSQRTILSNFYLRCVYMSIISVHLPSMKQVCCN
jgi:hypothetical protein